MSILTTTKKKTRSLTVTLIATSVLTILSPAIIESTGYITTELINYLP